MEDFFGIIIVLVLYFAAVGSIRKSARRKRGDKKRAARRPQFEAAFEEAAGKKAAGAERAVLKDVRQTLAQAARSAAPECAAAKREQDCQTSRLHLHDVTQEEMDAAGEGEDPCHGGHAPEPAPAQTADLFVDVQEEEALSQDVLRGVIMSEILTRPCERRKRSTYGR